jgi:hypothetical protein
MSSGLPKHYFMYMLEYARSKHGNPRGEKQLMTLLTRTPGKNRRFKHFKKDFKIWLINNNTDKIDYGNSFNRLNGREKKGFLLITFTKEIVGSGKRKTCSWTKEEEDSFLIAVKKHNIGNWKAILIDNEIGTYSHKYRRLKRSNLQLKDKHRTLQERNSGGRDDNDDDDVHNDLINQPITTEEWIAFDRSIQKHGVGNWKAIIDDTDENAETGYGIYRRYRTNVNLKDMYRSMNANK